MDDDVHEDISDYDRGHNLEQEHIYSEANDGSCDETIYCNIPPPPGIVPGAAADEQYLVPTNAPMNQTAQGEYEEKTSVSFASIASQLSPIESVANAPTPAVNTACRSKVNGKTLEADKLPPTGQREGKRTPSNSGGTAHKVFAFISLKEATASDQLFNAKRNDPYLKKPKLHTFIGPPAIKNDDLNHWLDKLSLTLKDHYPGKISIEKALAMPKARGNDKNDLRGIPWNILKAILSLDEKARYDIYHATGKQKEKETNSGSRADRKKSKTTDPLAGLNAQDIFLVIFSCCDLMLRQLLCQKLFLCRAALPLVFPEYQPNGKRALVMSCWAMSSIVLEWQSGDTAMEHTLADHAIQTIGFVRVGKPSFSKSQLINQVLDDQQFPTFTSKAQCNVECKRRVVLGMIEASFYLPSKEESHFKYASMICNLRGDALDHKTELGILSSIVSYLFIIVDQKHKHDPVISKIVNEREWDQTAVIVDKGHGGNVLSGDEEDSYINHLYGTRDFITYPIFMNSETKLYEKIRAYVANYNKGEFEGKVSKLYHAASVAEKHGAVLDITFKSIQRGWKYASEILKSKPEKVPVTDIKNNCLRLQGDPWVKWSNCQRKKNRIYTQKHNKLSAFDIENLDKEMEQSRKNQFQLFIESGSFITNFFSIFLQEKMNHMPYTAKWLSLHLDKIAREAIPNLLRQYNAKWSGIQKKSRRSTSEFSDELRSLEYEIRATSFGIEHFIREIGQLYESFVFCREHRLRQTYLSEKDIKMLPSIAAKLFLGRFPMEIMDGDVANIPLVWITAVMKEIKKKLGKKRIFVLSVLGVQNSGKSTLLNTMFGTDFAVNTGRCTNGVNIQLIPVEESSISYEYIIVLDTKGLRSSELGSDNRERDNMLATLVIGLGDVTIVNIKGENFEDMAEVLQIVVHAFLRMKLVNKQLKLEKRCVFVHQNVDGINVADKTGPGRRKLQENLDKNTKEVAKFEGREDIREFNNVIQFDCFEDILYFSGLWDRSPPMATIKHQYCQDVRKLKEHIFNLPLSAESTITTLTNQIKELWNALLTADFVLSFRNTKQFDLYCMLEKELLTLYWEKETQMFEWVNKVIGSRIKTSLLSDLGNRTAEAKLESRQKTKEIEKQLVDRLSEYMNDPILITDRDHGDNWLKKKQGEEILHFTEKLSKTVWSRISDAERIRNGELDVAERKYEWERIILDEAKRLGEQNRGCKRTKANTIFEDIWRNFCKRPELDNLLPENMCLEIDKLVDGKLRNLTPDGSLAILSVELAKLATLNSKKPGLTGSVSAADLLADGYVSERPKPAHFTPLRKENILLKISAMTEAVLGKAKKFMQKLEVKVVAFNENLVSELIKLIFKGVEQETSACSELTFNPAYTVRLAVRACHWAIPKFEQLQKMYETKQKECLKKMWNDEYRNKSEHLFFNIVEGKSIEEQAACLLFDCIFSFIENKLSKELPDHIASYIVNFFHTKSFLLRTVLDYLLTEESAEQYQQYLEDPKGFTGMWLQEYTNKKIFLEIDYSKSNKFTRIVRESMVKLMDSVKQSAEVATQVLKGQINSDMTAWSDAFCQAARKQVGLTPEILTYFGRMSINSTERFLKFVLENCGNYTHKILTAKQNKTAHDVQWVGPTPYELVLQKLWGCEEMCPTCNEPCMYTSPDHISNGKHACIQHRIHGVLASLDSFEISYERELTSCGFQISSGISQFSQWDISPDPALERSNYWKFVLVNLRQKLRNKVTKRVINVPNKWCLLTKQDALDSLQSCTALFEDD